MNAFEFSSGGNIADLAEEIDKEPHSESQQVDSNTMLCTVFTSEKPKVLTKVLTLNAEGNVTKGAKADMWAGTCEIIAFQTMQEFANFLPTLDENQALTYGVPKSGISPLKVVTKKDKEKDPFNINVIARTTEHMGWNAGPGVMCLDYDPTKGATDKPFTREELLAALAQVAPALPQATVVWWMSASSNIYNGDELVKGVSGQRVYIGVQDTRDIPRAGKALADRLWLAGYGYFEVSKSCALLERTLIDTSVWQPNRFDFAAGAVCTPPLRQERGLPFVYVGQSDRLLDTQTALPNISPLQVLQLDGLKADLRTGLKPKVVEVKEHYVKEQVIQLKKKNPGKTEDELSAMVERAVDRLVLMGDFEVKLDDGTLVKVSDLLDNREKYHRRKTYDPLEPDYDGNRVVGILYLDGGRPVLVSQAHGKRTFKLNRTPFRVEVVQGHTAELVDTVCDRLRTAPDVFDFGWHIATVDNGKVAVMTDNSLLYYLGSESQFWRAKPTNKDPGASFDVDPPMSMAKMLIDRGEGRQLRKLNGVTAAPTMRPDYSILDRPGYDAATKLYYAPDGDAPQVPANPSQAECQSALNYLMMPFKDFPFVGEQDRAALLSGLLSAVVRPGITTAPAHALDAPAVGSGKTLLAKCVSVLAGGVPGKIAPPISLRSGEDEIRKRILAMLAEGDTGVIWDNITGAFNSESLAGFLTSGHYGDRVLGKSETRSFPNRVLLLITGNNLEIEKDMVRRVIACRINANTEYAFQRRFNFDPLSFCVEHRIEMAVAALTVIRHWYCNKHHYGEHGKARHGSFEQWDMLVREPICWLSRVFPDQYVDPVQSISDAMNSDPVRHDLHNLLTGLHTMFGDRWFFAREVVESQPPEKHEAQEAVEKTLAVLSGRKDNTECDARFVGRELHKHRDTIVNGKRLHGNFNKHANTWSWRVVDI